MDVSIAVLCYNEAANLGLLLQDIERQETKSSRVRQILVVASGCTDETLHIAREYAKRDSRVCVVEEPGRNGKPSAIHRVIERMEGDALVLLSADLRIPRQDFVDTLTSHFADGIGVVGTRPKPVELEDPKFSYFGRTLWNLHDKTLARQARFALRGHVGEAFAIRREAMQLVPKDVINDDAYLAVCAQLRGFRVAYARELVVYNRSPGTSSELLFQRARVISGHAQLRREIRASPDVLDRLLLSKPLLALEILREEIREQISKGSFRARWFLHMLLLELAAHVIAKVHGDFSVRWPPSPSTKSVNI